ncbi:glucokinase [Gammaproteobacteria bacterium]|nr:glucokinase [Gammaproteobacteria bacterium]
MSGVIIGDVGGTNARFAVLDANGDVGEMEVLAVADHQDLGSALNSWRRDHASASQLKQAAIAIANPITDDQIKMTNSHWQFSIEATRRALGLDQLMMVNDLSAMALGTLTLEPKDYLRLGNRDPHHQLPVAVIGLGTGLGVSGLLPDGRGGHVPLMCEGGHTTFAACNARERAIADVLSRRFPEHLSWERLLAGQGIVNLHGAIAEVEGRLTEADHPAAITRIAFEQPESIAARTLDTYRSLLGDFLGDMALTIGARGGGICWWRHRSPPAGFPCGRRHPARTVCGTWSTASLSRRGADRVDRRRAIYIARNRPRTHDAIAQDLYMIHRIQAQLPHLRPSERRVGEYVLRHADDVVTTSIRLLAQTIGVSEPTVIRFCHAVDCNGYQELKINLARSLAREEGFFSEVLAAGDSPMQIAEKTINQGIVTLTTLREQLKPATLDTAVAALEQAKRIEFYGLGGSGLVALEAQQKFFRLGVPCVAYVDAHIHNVSASLLDESAVVVTISRSGNSHDLVRSATVAREVGAKVIAITAADSSLAKIADTTIAVELKEDSDYYAPLKSRLAQHMVIDALALGVGMRRGDQLVRVLRQAQSAISHKFQA